MREMEPFMIYIIIFGMAAVTYVPRFLPALFVDSLALPNWINHWLRSIPYAALGALIFPGILHIHENDMSFGMIGGAVAVIFSLLNFNLIFILIGSILSVIVTQYIFL
jgi:branched-subunit amino acid transport protein